MARDKQILIADDSKMNRALFKNVLNSKISGIKFYEAENGEEVISILEMVEIDLIILDLIMPIMDGYETIKFLKSSDLYKDIPVIVSSSITEISSIEITLKEGAIDYFTKPLSPDEMDIIVPLKVKNAINWHEQNKLIAQLNEEISHELKNANLFQSFLLPKKSEFENASLHKKYHPSLEIGGDFYDCIDVDGDTWFVIADVTGHGIAAAMASTMIKTLFRNEIVKSNLTPAKLLKNINDEIIEIFESDNYFENFTVFTSFVGCISNDKLTYANAAQPYPLIYKEKQDMIIPIKKGGSPIGLFKEATYEDNSLNFESGDSIFLYTDGLFSSGNNSDFVNWKIVQEYVEESGELMSLKPDKFLKSIYWYFHYLHNSEGSDFTDDVALMVIKKK